MIAVAMASRLIPHMGIEPDVAAQAGSFLAIQNLSLAPLLGFFRLRRYLRG